MSKRTNIELIQKKYYLSEMIAKSGKFHEMNAKSLTEERDVESPDVVRSVRKTR
jgi:hypothetical protein